MLIYIGIAFLCFSSILLRNCVMVARMTLDHTVWVRVLVPQPAIQAVFGGFGSRKIGKKYSNTAIVMQF